MISYRVRVTYIVNYEYKGKIMSMYKSKKRPCSRCGYEHKYAHKIMDENTKVNCTTEFTMSFLRDTRFKSNKLTEKEIGEAWKRIRKKCLGCKLYFIPAVETQWFCTKECEEKLEVGKYRWEILNRDNFTCQYCGRNPTEDGIKLHIDHIKSRNDGGKDIIDNYVTACEKCNRQKHTKPLRYEADFRKRLQREMS